MTHPAVPPQATAVPPQATAATVPPAPGRRTARLRSLLPQLTGIALLAVFLGGCDFVDQLKNPERYAAKVRLQAILTAVQAGNHMSQQDIICLFYLSSRNQCDMKDLDRGTRTFEQWLHKKNIQRGIDSFEIVDFWEDPTQKNLAYFFHVKINGKNAYIRVEHRVPLKWAKKMEKPTESG